MTALVKFGDAYNGQQLALVQGPGRILNWARDPVTITPGQLSTIKNLNALLAVLKNSWQSPEAAAGISTRKIAAPIIHNIVQKFQDAKIKYNNFLSNAENEDFRKLRSLQQNYTIKSYSGFFGFFYTVFEYFGAKYKSKDEVAKEASNHRLAFMQEVSTLESERLEDVKEKITRCIAPLLAAIANKQVEDLAQLRQLYQLTAIFKAHFPTETNAEIEAASKVLAGISGQSAALLTMQD
jgi:hypothetical protein